MFPVGYEIWAAAWSALAPLLSRLLIFTVSIWIATYSYAGLGPANIALSQPFLIIYQATMAFYTAVYVWTWPLTSLFFSLVNIVDALMSMAVNTMGHWTNESSTIRYYCHKVGLQQLLWPGIETESLRQRINKTPGPKPVLAHEPRSRF